VGNILSLDQSRSPRDRSFHSGFLPSWFWNCCNLALALASEIQGSFQPKTIVEDGFRGDFEYSDSLCLNFLE